MFKIDNDNMDIFSFIQIIHIAVMNSITLYFQFKRSGCRIDIFVRITIRFYNIPIGVAIFMDKCVKTRFVYRDGIKLNTVSGNKASYIARHIKLFCINQGISLKFANAGYLNVIKSDCNFWKMPEQGNINVREIYMGSQFPVNMGFNKIDDFSFEEPGRRP